jgi:hypothetical protein
MEAYMSIEVEKGDKAVFVPYENGPLYPAAILDLSEANGKEVVHGVYHDGQAIQVFSYTAGTPGMSLLYDSPMLEPLIEGVRGRIKQELEAYQTTLQRMELLSEQFRKYFG